MKWLVEFLFRPYLARAWNYGYHTALIDRGLGAPRSSNPYTEED